MKTGRIKDGYGNVQRDIMTDDRIDVFAKALYSLLVSYAGEKKACYPSLKTICDNLQISKPTVIKSIKQLIAAGFLVADKRKTSLGEHETNIYYPMYIMDEHVVKDVDNPVKDVYEGSKGDLLGVVKDVDTKINTLKINSEDNNLLSVETGFKQTKKNKGKEKNSGKKENTISWKLFYEFWDLYDKKVGLSESKRAWSKGTDEEHAEILKVLPVWKKNYNPKIDFPYPATFLNNERWKDEIGIRSENNSGFPDYWSSDFASKLDGAKTSAYWKHLRALDFEPKKNSLGIVVDWIKKAS